MVEASASTSDGYLVHLAWDKGRGTRFKDYFTELREFGETMTYYFLTIKGDSRVLMKLYDPIRAKGIELTGLRPIAMPVTYTSALAIFLWPQSAFDKFAEGVVLAAFSLTVSQTRIGKLPPKKEVPLEVSNPSLYLARERLKRERRRHSLQALGALILIVLLAYLLYVLYPILLSLTG
ncbi:MAG: hypothetical protein JRN06_02575 [Nitrososphaerota archaeon]|nr:hypothetical protein [Nitrososphaerota archaeon]MDG7023258.1 hypothetical protein [Nitrososphaerota archaeon]